MAFEARRLLQPGPIILFVALVLSILVSISLPAFTAMDISRIHWPSAFQLEGVTLDQLRFGIWDACGQRDGENSFDCPLPDATKGLGYTVSLGSLKVTGDSAEFKAITITSAWTRGLVFHPIATGLIFVAFIASIADSLFLSVIASFTSFFAALVMLIAFVIDIALHVHLKTELGGSEGGDVVTGPGFWLSFVSLILTLLAGCLVFVHHRRKSGNDVEMSQLFNFRRLK